MTKAGRSDYFSRNTRMSGQVPSLRIAIIANSAWNLHNFRRGITNALVAEGHEVFLVAPSDGTSRLLDDLPATFLPLKNLQRSGTSSVKDLTLLMELYRLYRTNQIDLALLFTAKPVIYGSVAARWAGVKCISTLTGLGYSFLRSSLQADCMKLMYRFALRKAHAVIYHNPDDRSMLLKANVCRRGDSYVVGGSGLPLAEYPLRPYSEAVEGRFIFVGRLLADKGIREFVAAAKIARRENKGLTFQVVGSPDPGNPASISKRELQAWVNEGEVEFIGQVDDVRPYLAQAQVIVLPSYREGCPRSLLEAGATGRAMIGTDVAGIREVVTPGESGWLIPRKQVRALADTMILAASEGNLERFGLYARQHIERKFSEANVVHTYLRLIGRTAYDSAPTIVADVPAERFYLERSSR